MFRFNETEILQSKPDTVIQDPDTGILTPTIVTDWKWIEEYSGCLIVNYALEEEALTLFSGVFSDGTWATTLRDMEKINQSIIEKKTFG